MLNLKDAISNIDSSNKTLAKYSHGTFRNSGTPGDRTGTPFTAIYMNDIYYALYHILYEMGVTPNNEPDNDKKSDFAMASHKKFTSRIWSPRVTYSLGDTVYKQATSTLLGSDAPRVTLVYRSRTSNNKGHALPADFISDDANWDWVDVIQPQGLNLLTLNIPVGSFMYLSADGLHPHEVPVNCAIADGKTYTRPDGVPFTTLNLVDRFPLGVASDVGNTGGSFSTSTNTDGEHYHGISFTSQGHTLSVAEMPSHTHTVFSGNANLHITYHGDDDRSDQVQSRPYWRNGGIGATGNNYAHSHVIYGHTNNDAIHKHHNFDITNPYMKLLPIERIF